MAHETVGVEKVDDGRWQLHRGPMRLGVLHERCCTIVPVLDNGDWKAVTHVLGQKCYPCAGLHSPAQGPESTLADTAALPPVGPSNRRDCGCGWRWRAWRSSRQRLLRELRFRDIFGRGRSPLRHERPSHSAHGRIVLHLGPVGRLGVRRNRRVGVLDGRPRSVSSAIGFAGVRETPLSCFSTGSQARTPGAPGRSPAGFRRPPSDPTLPSRALRARLPR